jgi:hypothetical protein
MVLEPKPNRPYIPRYAHFLLEGAALRDRLEQSVSETPSALRMLNEQRGVLNDVHNRLVTVTKGPEKQPR